MPRPPESDVYTEIPKLELPQGGFKSDIPQHLLRGKSDGEVWLLEKASKMDNFIEWAAPVLVQINQHQRKTDSTVVSHGESIELIKKSVTELESFAKESKETIEISKSIIKVGKKKAFWSVLLFTLIFILPWATKNAPDPAVFVTKIFGG